MPNIVSAGALILQKGKMLIVNHSRGNWDLPKGKMDPGETPWDTALREVWEESNVVISGPGISKAVDLKIQKYIPRTKDLHLFKVELADDFKLPEFKCHTLIEDTDTPEIVGRKWIDPKEYPTYLTENMCKVLKKVWR